MGRAEFKRLNLQAWMDQGIPVILDVSPGYDAREMFKGSAHWGHSDLWRNALSCHRSPRIKGIVYNSWNGYTEGMVGMRTHQKGTGWLAIGGERGPLGAPTSSEMSAEVAGARRTDFMSGRIYWKNLGGAFEVHGQIYKKYLSMEAAVGELGLPVSDELSLNFSFRCSRFQKGTIYWHPWTGAWVGWPRR